MNYSANRIKNNLYRCIETITGMSSQFLKNPGRDFSRNRKLPFDCVIKAVLSMSGGTLNDELMNFFSFSPDIPSSSAFVQQRGKIHYEAFQSLFHMFNQTAPSPEFYKGYRLLAVDGSDLHIPTNKSDKDSYYPGTNGRKAYNLLHLNAVYDLCSNTYVDAVIQKARSKNEHKAFVNMVDNLDEQYPAIIIADRGYESYNNLAHVQEKGLNFLIRAIDNTAGSLISGLDLPDENEFDFPVELSFTRQQTKETKELFKDRNRFKYFNHKVNFDYLPKHRKKSDPAQSYTLCFRIVRFKLSDDSYELVITNLDSKQFPPKELKKLYAMRWGIETSFRSLKYTVGLLYFHSKKTECVYQEIFARLIMYNFTQMIISCIIIKRKKRKYCYKINFSAAIHICRQYLFKHITPSNIEALIAKYVVPIRPNRKRPRDVTFKKPISFFYRVS